MRTSLALLCLVLFLVGVVWLGQGLGLIHGSFMTGERLWAGIGAACIVVALAGAFVALSARGPRRG